MADKTQVKCPECGKANSAGYRFCRGCGAKPAAKDGDAACPECQRVNSAGYKFCKGCGAPPPGAVKAKPAAKKEQGDAPADKIVCPDCQRENATGYKFCKGCGAPPAGAAPSKAAKKDEPKKDEPKPALKKKETDPPTKKAAGRGTERARSAACEGCSFPNKADYEKCENCGLVNPAFASAQAAKAEAEQAAAEKARAAAARKAAAPAPVDANEQLLKGMEFKTKAKGEVEVSKLKAGDLAPGMRVWATQSSGDWAPAEVVSVGSKTVTVTHDDDGSRNEYAPAKLFIRNPPLMDDVSDLTQLSYMHEPGLLYVLAERYAKDEIYTFTGTTLIAVNPYQRLPLYSKDVLDSYVNQPIGRMPPHVFAVAEDAFRAMMDFSEPQSVLVSGESGAGKTETTKVLLQYLAAMGALAESKASGAKQITAAPAAGKKKTGRGGAGSGGGGGGSGGSGGTGGGGGGESTIEGSAGGGAAASGSGKTSVEQQVLQSNPVLEAFGNAKTLRNDNSSRFGKFIRIQFDARGHIEGAQVLTYLLEKPRLTSQMVGERNFHVFYMLVKGANSVERKQLALKDVEDYHYLNQGQCFNVPNVDDAADFEVLREALKIFGIGPEEQKALWRYLSGILQLGNITFKNEDDDRDEAVLDQGKPLAYAAKLLGIQQDAIKKALLRRQATMGKSVVTIRLKVPEAEAARDAFAMLLYGRLFDHIVTLINKGLSGTGIDEESKRFIGVLDIYGFEFFEKNSFEQFCINWANEKLQQQFNQHIFMLEQAEYVREKIDWSFVEFADNQPILSLIEDKSPMGIVPILDEQCRFPKSDHLTFAEKLYADFKSHPYFEKPKFAKDAFTIDHYAGKVTYETLLFLEKNRDFLIPEHFIILGESTETFVQALFAEKAAEFKAAGGSMKFASVGSAFKTSLAELMSVINSTTTHYVRCIKPNDKKQAKLFQKPMSLHQLRCGGVLETMRIAAAGFPTRWSFVKFCERYRILAPLLYDRHKDDWKQCAAAIIAKIGLEAAQYQLGLTKVFLRAGLVALFEELLKRKLDEAAVEIQRRVRGWLCRLHFVRLKANVVAIQCLVRKYLAVQDLQQRRRALMATRIQAGVRSLLVRRTFVRLCDAAKSLQRKRRWRVLFRNLHLLVQKHRASQRHQEKVTRIVTRVQAAVRMKLQRRRFLIVRAEARDVKGKFQRVLDEKAGLEAKVEELGYRLTAEQRAKSQLQSKFEDAERELATLREDLNASRKETALARKATEEAERQVVAVREESAVAVTRLRAEHETALEQVRAHVETARQAAAVEGVVAEQNVTIAKLREEIAALNAALDDERARAKEISDSVMSLKAQEVEGLRSRIQDSFGFVPSEPYLGMPVKANPPALLATRQQLESLARMTGKKTKDEGVYAVLDFFMGVHEGFARDVPVLAFTLAHALNHWDCLRKNRDDIFSHVAQGISVDIPSMLPHNARLAYSLNSMLFLLHIFGDQLESAGVSDPWYVGAIVLDDPPELAEVPDDQSLLATILFLDKIRSLAANMYMELVFNIYEELDVTLRALHLAVSGGSWKAARQHLQAALSVLETTLGYATANFWPHTVTAAFLSQVLYYVCASWLNMLLSTRTVCSKASAREMQSWVADVEAWFASPKHAAFRDECSSELAPFRQALSLLTTDKEALGKGDVEQNRAKFAALTSNQARVLLENSQEPNERLPTRLLRVFPLSQGEEDADPLVDKTRMHPIPVAALHPTAVADLTAMAMPADLTRKLADKLARATALDDEYVVVDFDLNNFEIGDEMDDLELEEDLNLDDETAADAPELDDAMRAILMRLGTDAVAASRGGTMVSGMPSNTITYAAEPAAPSGGDLESSTNALVREKILARVGAKVAAPTPQLPTKAADPEWQIGDACDAVYLEDDQFYGALIVDGPDDKGQYLVVFTEYGNEQWTSAELLRESPGEVGLPLDDVASKGDNTPSSSALYSYIEQVDDPFEEPQEADD